MVVLAVKKSTEEYDDLRESLEDLRNEMSNLKEIIVNDYNFEIEYFRGYTFEWLEFAGLVCGLGKGNQDYACIWCKCPRMQRWDISKQWSITYTTYGTICLKEIANFSSAKKYNCKKPPLFDFIPMDHVIIDTLHLFLKISDVLIDLLVREIRRYDAIEKKITFSEVFARDKV